MTAVCIVHPKLSSPSKNLVAVQSLTMFFAAHLFHFPVVTNIAIPDLCATNDSFYSMKYFCSNFVSDADLLFALNL